MQKIRLLAVGKLKESWTKEAASHYESRIGHMAQFSIEEVSASSRSSGQEQSAEESSALLSKLDSYSGLVWAFDETGDQMTSQEFSRALEAVRDSSQNLTCIIGGAYGLTDDLRQRADRVVSLSSMTFPHELCRVIFLEQLYRALSISKGSQYHH